MSSTDPGTRQAFITGLRDLADYLTAHPDIPVPSYGTEILLIAASADDGGCAQVDKLAAQFGTPVRNDLDRSGHYETVRSFGPVGYCIVAISDAATARYNAHTSYWGCVTPDTRRPGDD